MIPRSPLERASLLAGGLIPRRGETWALAALLAGFVLMAAIYFQTVPPLEGFDATAHVRAVLHLRATQRLPRLDNATAQVSYELITQPPLYHSLAALAAAPWPVEPALALVQASSPNPYFEKGLSERQTLTLPNVPWVARAPLQAARGVALLGALLAVASAWWLARTLRPAQPAFALAVASVVAFNPVFLFLAVTVTNDGWAAGTVALTAALAARAAVQGKPPRVWLWAGAAGGLALLTKYSGFLAGVPSLVLLAYYTRRMGTRAALAAVGWALLGGILVAGGIYGRNLWLYGELAPLQRMAAVIPALNRAQPWPWHEVRDYVPWLVWSYWGTFVATIAPPAFLESVRAVMLVGLAGLPLALLRGNGAGDAAPGWTRPWTVAMALAWALTVAAAVLYWTRTVSFGEQGRLAHVAAPALALLWVMGWQAWLPARWQPALHGGMTAGMVGLALWGAAILDDAFHLPPVLANVTPDRVIDAHFAGGPVLLGVDLPNGAALAPGAPLALTLYWTTPQVIGENYTLFVHLAGQDNQLLYQFDGVPAAGRHPTRQWRPGEVFADSHTVALEDIALEGVALEDVRRDGLATLSVGLYPVADPSQRLAVRDAAGAVLGDRVILGPVRLHAQLRVGAPPPRLTARWQGGIGLAGATVQQDGAGQPVAVALTWWSETVQQQELTRFVQVLDAQNRVLAQADGAPQAGAWPVSTWRAGDQIGETVTLVARPGAGRSAWQRVVVGWYDRQGVRRRLVAPTAGQDFMTVMTRGE